MDMGQHRDSSGHRRTNSFDIRDFSFMKKPITSSRAKSQQYACRRMAEQLEQNLLNKRNSVAQRDPSIIQYKHESRRVESVPAWLKDSYDKRRNKRNTTELDPSTYERQSTKNEDFGWKMNEWPSQKPCSSENKIDQVHREHKLSLIHI